MKIKKVLLTKWRGEYKENRPLAQEKEKKRKHFFFSSFCERFSPSPDKKWGKPLERERLFSSRTKEMEHEASYFRCDFSLLTSSTAFLFRCVFYVPEAYLTHFSYRCWLLNCSVQRAIWVRGERDIVNLLRPASLVAISGPKKSWFLGPTPSNGPGNRCCPHQNHYVPSHINNRYINS